MTSNNTKPSTLTRFAWLSIVTAILTMGFKVAAYKLTDSVGLLSDALESLVNLVGGFMALAMLTIAVRPADENHPYGHSKAEYFSSGVEGTLILIAAVGIGIAAVERWMAPKPLEQIGLGLGVSVVASLINLGVSLVLLRAAKTYHSITLEANARHLLTDVWTSAGVLIGVGLVAVTGWERLDPVVALLVASNIVWSGGRIVCKSVLGLMDTAWPVEQQRVLEEILASYVQMGVRYHALRTRQAGARRFASFHVLVPGEWTVQRSHSLLERIEADIHQAVPNLSIVTHLEPLDDPASFND
ncbi:MAG: cation diffusion facilitator family transporter [Proteobacteria bacterium]|nr:cation diffusion facilitator family transporter [Pseudomonadota bacterium]